ncbi:NAD(P)-binding domain-containing protein [Fodinicola feengrottensis]|uniref:NAD(P)-binding domain-containing protein n=1 Tax=Fodinicola feengrottensis TaxID=435914 RepID=A0ABN2JAG9_9ACTN
MNENLPVVVVGAGPIGLATAAQLVERGLEPIVLEAGAAPGAAVREWHHVRLFSRWGGLIDPAAARLLGGTGWQPPAADGYPTGLEWATAYLQPLAAALGSRVRLNSRVVGVTRRGRDRVVDAGRDEEPLTVRFVDETGAEQRMLARAVIDASGTWSLPNPVGGDGLPALGEIAAAKRISYRVPDLADPTEAARYAGKRVAVVGSGHSALTALVTFTQFAPENPGTELVWVLRRGVGNAFGGGESDQLVARGALGQRAKAAVDAGHVDVVTGFRTTDIDQVDNRLVLVGDDGRTLDPVDEVVAVTGFRPDLSWLSEVRLDLDARLQAPVALAPLIDPNVHSCGTVYPHGAKELAHPEPNLYLVGMKSYGRAPTFLAMTGYEQVRSVVAGIAGDQAAAERIELTLPDTGVCGGAGLFDEPGADAGAGGCCVPAAVELTLTAPPRD